MMNFDPIGPKCILKKGGEMGEKKRKASIFL